MLNFFRLVKCSSLFFSLFSNLVVQVRDVFKDVCTCFLSCCFRVLSPSLYNLLFKYKMLLLDQERMDGNTTRGSLSVSFIIFVLFKSVASVLTSDEYKLLSQTLLVLVTVKDTFLKILFLSNQIHRPSNSCPLHIHFEHTNHWQFRDLKPK